MRRSAFDRLWAYMSTLGCPEGLQDGLRFVSLPPCPFDDRVFHHFAWCWFPELRSGRVWPLQRVTSPLIRSLSEKRAAPLRFGWHFRGCSSIHPLVMIVVLLPFWRAPLRSVLVAPISMG